MPCVCLSRRKKERPRSVPLLQTDLPIQTDPTNGFLTEPFSPAPKFDWLTLLARIERAFHPSKAEKVELPAPLRPESIVGLSLHPAVSYEPQLVVNTQDLLQPLPRDSAVLPTHPDPVGLVHPGVPGNHPNIASSEIPPKSRPRSLIIQPHFRSSQYAVVHDTSHHIQPPISPEPTSTICNSNSSFQPHNNPVPSPQSAASTPSSSTSTHLSLLRPRFNHNGLMTPPLTPPPNVPLPPIPAASAATRPQHASFHVRRNVRDIHTSQLLPYRDKMHNGPSSMRQRSQSSPLSSGTVISSSTHLPAPNSTRQSRSFSSPDSYVSAGESESSDETIPTSEESVPNDIPIALFESSYSPPPPLPVIQDFSKQLLGSQIIQNYDSRTPS